MLDVHSINQCLSVLAVFQPSSYYQVVPNWRVNFFRKFLLVKITCLVMDTVQVILGLYSYSFKVGQPSGAYTEEDVSIIHNFFEDLSKTFTIGTINMRG